MTRPITIPIEIVKGEDFSFRFPAITDAMAGRTARIKRVDAANDRIVFYGDVRDIMRIGAAVQIENNGDPDSNVALVVQEPPQFDHDGPTDAGSYGDPETTVTFAANAVPVTIEPNGYARRAVSMPVDLTTNLFSCQVRTAVGGDLVFEFEIEGGADGVAVAELTAAETAVLDFERAVYDVKRGSADANPAISFPFRGDVILRVPVTTGAIAMPNQQLERLLSTTTGIDLTVQARTLLHTVPASTPAVFVVVTKILLRATAITNLTVGSVPGVSIVRNLNEAVMLAPESFLGFNAVGKRWTVDAAGNIAVADEGDAINLYVDEIADADVFTATAWLFGYYLEA